VTVQAVSASIVDPNSVLPPIKLQVWFEGFGCSVCELLTCVPVFGSLSILSIWLLLV
jgi:hypothetical protein